jgi:hypothetical protein
VSAVTESRSPLAYVALVFALAIPFWLAGALTDFQLLPGLPVSAAMAVCPMLAASILVHRQRGSAGVRELLRRSFDAQKIEPKTWYLPIILLMPGLMVLSYGLMRAMGMRLPAPDISPLTALALFALFFLPALTEEAGWSGYVIDPLQSRWSALSAAMVVGLVWAVWHAVPYLQAGRSPAWIAGQFVATVALRVLIVWLYNNTGSSVFAAILTHAMANVSEFVFPINGSFYDPLVASPLMAAAAAIVAFLWGPRTLAQFRFL